MSKLALSIAITQAALFTDAKAKQKYAIYAGVDGKNAVLAGLNESFRVPVAELKDVAVGSRLVFNDAGDVVDIVNVKPVPTPTMKAGGGCTTPVLMSNC